MAGAVLNVLCKEEWIVPELRSPPLGFLGVQFSLNGLFGGLATWLHLQLPVSAKTPETTLPTPSSDST